MLIAPAALLLAWEGLRAAAERGGRGYALAGGALALVSVAFFLFLLVVLFATGSYPFWLLTRCLGTCDR